MFYDFELQQLTIKLKKHQEPTSDNLRKHRNADKVLTDYFADGKKRTVKQVIIDTNLKSNITRDWLRKNCKINITIKPFLWSKIK